jgi:hypothetical protein
LLRKRGTTRKPLVFLIPSIALLTQFHSFHLFFNQIDNYKERHFLYLTSKGLEAIKGAGKLDEQRAAKSKNDGADAMEMQ